jgi:hypothetical protein
MKEIKYTILYCVCKHFFHSILFLIWVQIRIRHEFRIRIE